MTEFVVSKSYLKMLQNVSSVNYFVAFMNLLWIILLFYLERSVVNYFFMAFGIGIYYCLKEKSKIYSLKMKNSQGCAIIFDKGHIVYRKMSGDQERFSMDACKILMLVRKIDNKKNSLFILKTKNKFHFVGPLENKEELLKYTSENNIKVKRIEKSSTLEIMSGVILIIVLLSQTVLLPSFVEGLLLFLLGGTIAALFYRFITNYYTKHFLICKELGGTIRLMSMAYVLWSVFLFFAAIPITQRDSLLDKLQTSFDRIKYEKNPVKKEKLFFKFKEDYTKFFNDYPNDKTSLKEKIVSAKGNL